jgi:hypothetical protein
MTEDDSEGFDYIAAQEMLKAKAGVEAGDADADADDDDDDDDEDDDDGIDEDDLVFKDLGADGTLAFDGGYGATHTLSPTAVKYAVKNAAVLDLDDDVKALFKAAAKRGDYIIAMVT